MSRPNPVPMDRVCVSFGEALNWIAFRNFGGSVLGPLPFKQFLGRDTDDSGEGHNGRLDLAEDLLLACAARKQIRLYAFLWELEGASKNDKWAFVEVKSEFVARARIDYEGEGPTLYRLSEDEEDAERYERIFVDYDDLTNFFWGKDDSFSTPHHPTAHERGLDSAPIPEHSPRRMSRRGRPTKHKWPELTAAAVERCLMGPIAVQEDLVREMLEWCIEHWGEEPSLSHVRDYVAPIFRQFEARWRQQNATEIAEKSEPVAEA
jgi:hypothetical protein